MARIQAPQGPNATPSYEPPKAKRAPKRTHGLSKGTRPHTGRGGSAPKGNSKGGPAAGNLDDTQLGVISNDHEAYFKSLTSPFFGSMSSNPYFEDYMKRAYQAREDQYYRGMQQNPNLHYATFMQQQGYGGGAAQLAPLGTGQAGQVDTGNPFTSSSGLGGPVAPTAPLGPRPNHQQHPHQFQLWKQQKKQIGGKPATLGQLNINPVAVDTRGVDADRRGFLALSPQERGDVALGKVATPGKWSAWG